MKVLWVLAVLVAGGSPVRAEPREIRPERNIGAFEAAIISVTCSLDGRLVAAGGRDRTILVAEFETGRTLHQLAGHESDVGPVVFAPDSKRLYSGSWDRTIREWDLGTGAEVRVLRDHRWPVLTLAISPQGDRLLSGSDGFRLWDLAKGEVLAHNRGHWKTVWSVNFSADGTRVLTGSWDETMRLWDADLNELAQFEGHSDRVKSVRFGPDGKIAASSSTRSPVVHLWDLERKAKLRDLEGEHEKGVTAIAFTPDGSRLLSGSGTLGEQGRFDKDAYLEADVCVWNVGTGELVARLKGQMSYVTQIAVTPDGRYAIASGKLPSLLVWRLPDVE